MKRSVRIGVFETNSSSTHSIIICSAEEYEKWVNGDTILYEEEKFYTRPEVIDLFFKDKYFKKRYPNLSVDTEELDDILAEFGAETYTAYYSSLPEGCEEFKKSYITKRGDAVIVFGYYCD